MNNSLRTIDYTVKGDLLFSKSFLCDDDDFLCTNLTDPIIHLTEKNLLEFNILKKNETNEIIHNIQTIFLPKPLTTYSSNERQCNRICVIDSNFARLLWSRMSHVIQKIKCKNEQWKPLRINDCMRISEYPSPSIGFTPHYDNQYNESDTIKSFFSIVIYLNNGFDGGDTLFYECDESKLNGGITIREEIDINGGIDAYKLTRIKPISGNGILFDHSFLHASDKIIKGTKYIIRTDLIFETVGSQKYTKTILDQLKYHTSLNFFRDAQFLELNGKIDKASEFYERANTHKIHQIPINDIWFVIIQFSNFREMNELSNVSKAMHSVIKSNRSLYWKSFCEINQKISGPWIPRVIAKKGCLTKFKFVDKHFFRSNLEQCLKVITMYCIYLFTNKLMQGNGTYVGKYDYVTGKIHCCDLTNLLSCVFFEKPIFGSFYNFYKYDRLNHVNFEKPNTNIDQQFIEMRHRHQKNKVYPDNVIDFNFLEMSQYDAYLKSLKTKPQIIMQMQQIEKINKYMAIVKCSHKCIAPYTTLCVDKSIINTNCLMFDFSKQKITITACEDTKCKICLSSLGKGFIANINELEIPEHMHAACSHYYKKNPSTSTNEYSYHDTKYIDKIHIMVSNSKKAKIETYYEGHY